MEHAFVIKSAVSDFELAFVEREGDYFTVVLRSREISAVRRVWGYSDCHELVGLLSHLAKQEQGWTEQVEWFSLEQEFVLRFRSDRSGHVFVEIELSKLCGAEDWRMKAEIQTELGQLPTLARAARVFFHGRPNDA